VRLLFIDRVTVLEYRKRVAATLEYAPDDPLFVWHFPSYPVVPASLLIESFAQAATVLVETGFEFTKKALPGYILNAKFHRPIGPGELAFELEAEQWSDDAAVVRGRALQRGARCATCTLGMVTAPLEDFFGREHMPRYRETYERWLADAAIEGFSEHPLERLNHVGA
jgi:3-hydroxyacyl-[acyl-carrier-protein] dehydratase